MQITDFFDFCPSDDSESETSHTFPGPYRPQSVDYQEEVVNQEKPELSENTPSPLPDLMMKLLGDTPAPQQKTSLIHEYLSTKWTQWIREGIQSGTKEEIMTKYSGDDNPNLNPPSLNPEIASSVPETTLKRDRHFLDSQILIATAMKALGTAMTPLLETEGGDLDRYKLIEHLSNAGKILSELQFNLSVARKSFISPVLNKELATVFKESKIDTLLYGTNLTEKIRESRSIDKTSQEICKKPQKPSNQKNHLNWKRPSTRQGTQGGYRQRPYRFEPQQKRPMRRQYSYPRFNSRQ